MVDLSNPKNNITFPCSQNSSSSARSTDDQRLNKLFCPLTSAMKSPSLRIGPESVKVVIGALILATLLTTFLVFHAICSVGHAALTPQIQVDLPDLATVNGVSVTGDRCGASLDTVEDTLNQEHGSLPATKRYWFRDTWMDLDALLNHTIAERRDRLFKADPQRTMCVLASIKGMVPCVADECILTLHIRPGMSDISVVKQLFERGDYNFIQPFRPATVLDAGANVGFATLIFGTYWPNARIVSVEANEKNARLLKRNTRHLRNVVVVNAGLFNFVGKATVFDDKTQKTSEGWKYRVKLTSDLGPDEKGEDLDVVTVDFLQRIYNLDNIDFAKIDIEGAEWEVFSSTNGYDPIKWINTTKLVSVEMHDRMRPGVSQVVGEMMASLEHYSRKMSGEYVTWEDTNS